MCGIAGILRTDGGPADPVLVRAMTSSIAHRGPDGDGYFVDGAVGLGHRRLSIIDLVTGDQPMRSADGALCIVFNGEIYNFRELRRELEARGRVFRTNSDTEVILHAYDVHGPDCVARLRGMFAFALWDGRLRRLFVARDRVGIKPMYWSWDGRRFLFGSELKALVQDPTLSRDLDWAALGDYFTYHYVPSPASIFASVRKLPPGGQLLIGEDGAPPAIARYWDLQFAPEERRSDEEWLEGLDAHLRDAVRSHMIADVPIGAFLSGGLDSSTVVALMAQQSAAPIRTFSIGFDEADFDELAWARQVAQRYGTEHCEFVVKPDALDALPALARQFDEPFADQSAIPAYYVARMTREHVTVALSGDGGDEVFAGYRRYARAEALHGRLDRLPARLARPLFRMAARLVPADARGRGALELLGADPIDRYFRMMTFHRRQTLARLLSPAARARVPAIDAGAFERLAAGAGTDDYVSALQYVDTRTYLPEDILVKVDRTSMLCSLEARVPLLDHVLLEWVATMPPRLKMAAGRGKAILRRLMAPHLPDGILHRRKMGFGVPIAAWLRGDLRDMCHDLLLDRRFVERGVFDVARVERLVVEHERGTRDRSSQLWALICFEQWAQQWMDSSPSSPVR